MPALSRRERVARLQRQLLSPERWIDARLVVEDHTGAELFRVGGAWDCRARAYVERECAAKTVRLKESQTEAGQGFARWLESSRRGVVDPQRAIVMLLGGARGSGKTWFVGLAIVCIGLEWPDEWQYNVNLSTGQRREVIEAIEEVSRPDWIADRSDDLRDPWLRFVTGSTLAFVSSRNPKRLREAKLRIRAVHINEGQDQDEAVYVNAVSATRNVDGLVVVATNRPQNESGDWVSLAATGIEGGEIVGQFYLLDPRKNDAVSRVALDKRAAAIRVVSPEAAAADTDPDAPMRLATKTAYPAFRPLPVERGGHIGDVPDVGWTDITVQITGALIGSGLGYPYICGVDFQREPGVIGAICKIYRFDGRLVLAVLDQIGVRGVEPDFSQALYAAGYRPSHGADKPPILLVGDGTGGRQNANHNFAQPTSFVAMQSDGWKIIGPDVHWKHGIPWNPGVRESRAQMHTLLEQRQILISRKCKEPSEGFPSLVDSFRRAPIGPKGGLVEKGNFQHGPDGVRYVAWRFLPRPEPKKVQGMDVATFDALREIRIFGNG